jgi:hypothetical protein
MTLFENTDVTDLNDVKRIRLVIDGLESEDIWMTSISGQVSPNYQILYSLGAQVFINAFNNRLGQFKITGIYVPEGCQGEAQGGTPPFIDFYKKVQITHQEPAKITYDGISIKGWAIAMTLKNYSQNNIDGHEFTIEFLGRVRGLNMVDVLRQMPIRAVVGILYCV